jgi:fibronectin type 3 domain-containing protein
VNKAIVATAILAGVLVVGAIGFKLFHANGRPHTVSLAWQPPAPVAGVKVTKYYVYRSTAPGGPYVRIGSTSQVKYEDRIIQSGRVYYYTVTAVDEHERESKKSLETTAAIP